MPVHGWEEPPVLWREARWFGLVLFFNMSSTFGATLGLSRISDLKLFSGCFLHMSFISPIR